MSASSGEPFVLVLTLIQGGLRKVFRVLLCDMLRVGAVKEGSHLSCL